MLSDLYVIESQNKKGRMLKLSIRLSELYSGLSWLNYVTKPIPVMSF